ncbi:MAG: TRAP transporter large permease [Peptoniphilus sp.]|uniref:TRAP transporter large permease n=1 Tax=Peptoniphilus sp. TaxID=1971214 RepID=UPI0025D98F6D|nr:TRAP transporter large permease [Peptoniphilus sp.]MCI5643572.1 TRAP transporter large permease [Peptoniphilus sp.]MDD7353324.1 TRAP transporter large permease [Peptoniphilaceae bacterium]MDY3903529.1 TRAP transporter large permease [Peptoniphilus sp.]
MISIMFIVMFALIFIGLPVYLSILGSGSMFLIATGIKPLLLVSQRMTTGLDSFPLLAIPLFVLVGELMDRGGISKRMINWADALMGWVPGGLGVVTIVSCAIFAALTGSGPATVAAIGSIMIPSLNKTGYDKKTASGMVAAGGALGPIIPPSIPMIIYGVTMGLSIPKMFIAGILPGIVMMLLLIIVNFILIKNKPDILNNREKFSFIRLLKNTWSALGALLLPVIILGGIYSGVFTPTEAAAVGVVYALLLGLFIYREIKIKDLPEALLKAMETAAMVGIIMGAANLLSWIMSVNNFGNMVTNALSSFITTKYSYLIVLMILLFFVGALMDTVAAIIILAPVLVPFGLDLGIDPLHLGMIFVINLVIGYVTPPFGYNLFTAQSITGLKFNDIVKGVMPFLIIELISVLLFAFVPNIITIVPNMLGL